jgi:hypothetical protein
MKTEIKIEEPLTFNSDIKKHLKINPQCLSIELENDTLYIFIKDEYEMVNEDFLCYSDITKQQAKVLGNALITYSELME